MSFIRFVVGVLLAAISAYLFGGWAQAESEQQIGKMQLNAYNTPGAESPVPPQVVASGAALLSSLWMAERRVLRLPGGVALLALLLGLGGGIAALLLPARDDRR